MSLHALANHMQAQGRNGDSVLVHMTPGEVHGLHALAVAHGGSLTINPHTGLPEASFLSSLLPTIIGGALTVMSGGALSPLMAAGITGAGYGLATGSLTKGLMAGLGAYGGAGMGAGLTEVGAGVMPEVAPAAANAPNTMIESGQGLADKLANAGNSVGTHAGPGINTSIASTGTPNWYDPTTWQSNADKFMPGVKESFGNGMEGLKNLYGKLPTGTLPALGAYTLMGGMSDKNAGVPAPTNQGMIRPYTLDRQQNQDAYKTYADSHGQLMPIDSRGNPMDSSERTWFTDKYTAGTPYKAPGPEYAAEGGLMGLAVGGQPEQQAAFQAVGMNSNYPMAHLDTPMYSTPQISRPMTKEVVNPGGDAGVDMFTGEPRGFAGGGMTAFGSGGFAEPQSSNPTVDYKYNPKNMEYTETTRTPPPAQIGGKGLLSQLGRQGAFGGSPVGAAFSSPFQGLIPALMQQQQPTETTRTIGGMSDPYIPPNQTQIPSSPQSDIANYAVGGIADLGDYSDGGRLLKGPGDGVSDSIPASIGNRQPARLADGEFVVPARIVSEIGNGSTEAGARKLYQMMDRVQHARGKTTGKNQVAKNTNAERYMPA